MKLPNKVSIERGLFSTAIKLFNHDGKQGMNVKFTPNSLIDKTSLYVM